ncbi:hypothetical protein PV326_002844 [Microctonus aethiopoides]|nr:hypothetical protein PV326_002844 [Microctonus aethiopoides]
MKKTAEYETLSLTLVEENGNKVILNWQKTEQLLLNKHMPMWIARFVQAARAVHHELVENFIPENIGNFILYRDHAKSSAVVYIENSNNIYGEIGQQYIIDALPLKELNREHFIVGSQYIKRRNNILNYPSVIEVMQDTPPERCYSHEGASDTNNKVTDLYPEILILVTHDVLEEAKKIDRVHYYAYLVLRYIVYFNTISMLFDKLSTESIKIHINIAGIIVEGERSTFPFTIDSSLDNDRNMVINGRSTLLGKTPQYLRRSGFDEDSFDFFFISTGLSLEKPLDSNGFSTPQHDIYRMRIVGKPFQTQKCLGSIVQYHEKYPPSFSLATKRIAWLMNIKSGIVDLQWNAESFNELQRYARFNKNHCYLLNYPRSLYPYGHPIPSLSPADQCICYGYEPSDMVYH